MLSNINVAVYKAHYAGAVNVVFWRGREDDLLSVYVPTALESGEIVWKWEDFSSQEAPPPTFVIPEVLLRMGVVQDLVDAIGRELGIKASAVKDAESVSLTTQAHLQDLRRILFNFDWVELQRGTPLVKEEESGPGS